jgi:Holliday junction DNA helicase RuvA
VIGYLTGTLLGVEDETILLDVSGVGYEVQLSGEALSVARQSMGHRLSLYIHTHVREDQFTLFGFLSLLEKRVFLQLLSVNGIGPKLAIKVLSGGPLDHLLGLIESGDAASLAKLPRVGRKTAEQIVLQLRGVLPARSQPSGNATGRESARGTSAARFGVGIRGEVGSALVHLGFRSPEIEGLLLEMPDELDFEEGVRWGLQRLSSL